MDEPQTLPLETPETALIELSTEASQTRGVPVELAIDLTQLPERLDDRTLDKLKTIAALPLPIYEPSDREWFNKCMKSLSILPRKADDEVKGALRLELYWRKLQGYPKPALAFLVDRGLDEFDWFPTVKQCRELLERWSLPGQARGWRAIARRKIEDEYAKRWRDLCWRIRLGQMTEEQVNELPERAKQRLDTEGLVRGVREEPFGPIIYRLRPSTQVDAA